MAIYFRDAQQAFKDAIRKGELSDDPKNARYAGRYMYMHSIDGQDTFKHVDSRNSFSTKYNVSSTAN